MSGSSLERPGRREGVAVCVLIVVAVFAIYAPVRDHAFVNLDDVDGILEHPLFQEGLTPSTVVRHFTEPYQHNWIPLNWLSLHLNHAIGGRDPTGYLLTNVALHALGSLLLFGLLVRLTGAFYCAAFSALFFAVHPLHVESVAWASERKDVLSGVFFMLTLLAYARHAERGGGAKSLVPVALLLLLGLMAKPMLVTLPFVMLLLDFWPLGRLRNTDDPRLIDQALLRARVVEKLPLFAIVAAVAVVTYGVQASSGAMSDFERIPLGPRIANALNAYLVYISQTALPQGLAVLYPLPDAPDWAGAAGAGALLVGATAIAVAAAQDRPYLLVGWLWFVGMLVPVIGLVQVGTQAHADRYMYLPQIGLGIAIAWGAADAARRTPASRPAVAVVATLVLGWFGGLAWQQVHFWENSVTLYGRALAVTGGNSLAHKGLADALLARGRLPEAALHYQEANALRPGWIDAELGLADTLAAQGRAADAIPLYERWVALAPDEARPLGSLGLALLRVGRPDDALAKLDAALESDPTAAELHAGRGAALAALGRPRDARDAYRAALRWNPDLTDAKNNLAWLLAVSSDPAVRDPEQAVRLAEEALSERPGAPSLLDTAAAAYAAAGRFEDALAAADAALAVVEAALANARTAAAQQAFVEMSNRRDLYANGQAYVEDR